MRSQLQGLCPYDPMRILLAVCSGEHGLISLDIQVHLEHPWMQGYHLVAK